MKQEACNITVFAIELSATWVGLEFATVVLVAFDFLSHIQDQIWTLTCIFCLPYFVPIVDAEAPIRLVGHIREAYRGNSNKCFSWN